MNNFKSAPRAKESCCSTQAKRGIVTAMRPTLSALVHQVLLTEESAADEAVQVHPAPLLQSDDENSLGAKRSQAYLNTQKWRDAVMRHYAFLDSHSDVGDVIVRPIAGSEKGVGDALGRLVTPASISQRRIHVLDQREAAGILSPLGIDIGKPGPRDIVFVPVVGAGFGVPVNPNMLPSAWIIVHSMFDVQLSSGMSPHMPKCSRSLTVLEMCFEKLFNHQRGGSIPLLLNCGWSENAFHMVVAAHKRSSNEWEGFYNSLADDFEMPPIGKLYKSHSDVPVNPGMGGEGGTNYVFRGSSDVFAEIMTIAVVKPEGVKFVMDRFDQIPDEFVVDDGVYNKIVGPNQRSLTSDERKRIRQAVEEQLVAIRVITRDMRDRLASDLAGKVIFFSVH